MKLFPDKILGILLGAVMLLYGYHFISAAPTAPPNSNAEQPLNVGSVMQSKAGNVAVSSLATLTEVRSNRYCDALGANCVSTLGQAATPLVSGTVPSGVYGGSANRDTLGATVTFAATFVSPFTAVPVIALIPKDYRNDDQDHCEALTPIQKTKTGFTVTYRVNNYYYGDSGGYRTCTLPTALDWMAVGQN